MHGPTTAFAQQLFTEKFCQNGESIDAAIERVARGLCDPGSNFKALHEILGNQRFLPGGRVMAAIGAKKDVTAYNCFVSGTIDDSFVDGSGSIMHRLAEAAKTMRMGGGIGYDFSTLRPAGALINKLQSHSSGPLSFMKIYDANGLACSSAGHRRGAQMAVLRVDHPDIEAFIRAKQPGKDAQVLLELLDNTPMSDPQYPRLYDALQLMLQLKGFNISVALTDDFMRAVTQGDTKFDLKFAGKPVKCINPQVLWEELMLSTWHWAEPGALFIDKINKMNNLNYCETITATNPCFVGSTRVFTSKGLFSFFELEGKTVNVLTRDAQGRQAYREMSDIRCTQRQASLVEVKLKNGGTIRCTPEHRFARTDGHWCEAQQLLPETYLLVAGNMHVAIVDSVSLLEEKADVYCGTVEETHCFYVSSGHVGVLVHNCGEQPLPPFGACLLGSFNLTKYLRYETAEREYSFNFGLFTADIEHVVRAMDNVIEASRYPLREQEAEAQSKRRMGLGVTGLANTIEALGHSYGDRHFLTWEKAILDKLRDTAYEASSNLAKEKGSFPLYNAEAYRNQPFMCTLPGDLRVKILDHGLRNSHLLSIAPTGTISLCADNVSSSIEPVFSYETNALINHASGQKLEKLQDYGVGFLGVRGKRCRDVTVEEHLAVLATAQENVDSAVSKTCNVPATTPWNEFKDLYIKAWRSGCKGLTTYMVGGRRAGVISSGDKEDKVEGAACKIDPQTGRKNCE